MGLTMHEERKSLRKIFREGPMDEKALNLEEFEKLKEQPVILFHGFSGEQLNALIDTLKHSPAFASNIIMATTTPTSV